MVMFMILNGIMKDRKRKVNFNGREKNFENRIKRWFHSVGIYPAGYRKDKMVVPQELWYVKIWGGGFQKSGIPDILICVSGVFIGCEVKEQTGNLHLYSL